MTFTTTKTIHMASSLLGTKPGLESLRTLPRSTSARTCVSMSSNRLDMGNYRQTETQCETYRASASRKLLQMETVNVSGFSTESITRKNACSALTTSFVVRKSTLNNLSN